MSDAWRERVFTAAEAADMAGLRRGTLDQWTIRQPAELFSEKRGYRRWFSPQDIAILRLARELEQGGMTLLTAIACASEHLQETPEPDAVFAIKPGTTACTDGRFVAALPAIDQSIILIPAGKIVAGIQAACADLRKTAA